jgi:GH18 family chitinase
MSRVVGLRGITFVSLAAISLLACSSADVSEHSAEEPVATAKAAVSAGRVVAYVDGTVGTISTSGLDATKYTHINYAFANLDANGNVYFTYPAQDSANLNAIKGLKSQNPNLKILISVGGWTWSNHFSSVAGDATRRTTMVNSLWSLVNNNNVDGIDIDWEWPGWQGEGDNGVCGGTCDGSRLVTLMQQIWNARGSKLVTMAGGAHPNMGSFVDLGALSNYVHFLNIMTYDFHGPWEPAYAPHANLYGGDISIDSAVNMYLNEGFPANKLVVGIPFYGKAWGMSDPSPLFKNISCTGTNEGASCSVNGIGGHTLHYDNAKQAAYMDGAGHYISFDNIVSVGWKTSYINNRSLGGAMYWSALQDNSSRTLTNKIWADIGGTSAPPPCSTVQLFLDHYYGGASYCVPAGEFPNLGTIGVPNDAITSIKVASGYTAILYQHGSFAGTSLTRTSDDVSLVDDGWNDIMSSIKVISGGGGGGNCGVYAHGAAGPCGWWSYSDCCTSAQVCAAAPGCVP